MIRRRSVVTPALVCVRIITGLAPVCRARVAPFFEGLTGEQRLEVENQSNYIAQLAYKAAKSEVTRLFGAVGRNEPCPCGSGVKFKKCHGA